MEPGAGTSYAVLWKHQATKWHALILKVVASIQLMPTLSPLSRITISLSPISCITCQIMKRWVNSLIDFVIKMGFLHFQLMGILVFQFQVILVGHSAGGLNMTDAIHRFGCNKIRMAIYIAANMLKRGFITDQDYNDVSFILFCAFFFFFISLKK